MQQQNGATADLEPLFTTWQGGGWIFTPRYLVKILSTSPQMKLFRNEQVTPYRRLFSETLRVLTNYMLKNAIIHVAEPDHMDCCKQFSQHNFTPKNPERFTKSLTGSRMSLSVQPVIMMPQLEGNRFGPSSPNTRNAHNIKNFKI